MDNRIKINTCIYRKDIIHKGKRKRTGVTHLAMKVVNAWLAMRGFILQSFGNATKCCTRYK